MRPWLLSLSLERSHIHLSRQRQEQPFNTLCLSPTPPSRHVPSGLTQTKPTQRSPISLASQLWQHPAEGQSLFSRFYRSSNQPPDKSEQKRKHVRTMHNRSSCGPKGRKKRITRGFNLNLTSHPSQK